MPHNPFFSGGHNPALTRANHDAGLANRMSHHAQAMAMKQHRQAFNIARKSAAQAVAIQKQMQRQMAKGPRIAGRAVRVKSTQEVATQRLNQLKNQLRQAASRDLACHRLPAADGTVGLFFDANWTSADGVPQVVFSCNTTYGAAKRPVAAFTLDATGLSPLGLRRTTLHAAVKQGRVYIFGSTVVFSGGEAYAIRPALSVEHDGGPSGFWTFSTAGLYAGELFIIGSGSMGYFENPARSSQLVARPVEWHEKKGWIWLGRSTSRSGGKLTVHRDARLELPDQTKTPLHIPPVAQTSEIAMLGCVFRDTWGDPLAIAETQEARSEGIVEIGGVPHFYARPNGKDREGKLLFARRCETTESGESVLRVSRAEGSPGPDVELLSNRTGPDGSGWVVKYANRREKDTGLPLVLVKLRQAAQP